MTNADQGRALAVQPEDPAMQPVDPALFASLTMGENEVLGAHLTSGWYKQAAVYPTLSEPWKETAALLDDLRSAWNITWKGESQLAEGSPSTEPEPEPEAGQ
jgi:hypothetical protein